MAGFDRYNDRPYTAEQYLASVPMKIHFAGWETDTYRLQQNGWQLSAAQDYMYRGMQIAFQHPEYRIRGITNKVDVDYYRHFAGVNMYDRPQIEFGSQMASDFITHTSTVAPFEKFQPIDAEPQWLNQTQRMSGMVLFAPNLARTQEIIVPEHSVDDLLNMMLEKQAANREQLIRRRVREQGQQVDFGERQRVHAQLISIAA